MADDLYDALMRGLKRGRDQESNYRTVKADLWKIVITDKDRYLAMFFHNWFNNNWTRPLDLKPPSRKEYKGRKLSAEKIRLQRKEDANMRGITFMNMFLSDGETRVKDATGAQIRTETGWFQLIAKHVKPNEIVGRKLTAEQLFNLHEQSISIKRDAA